MFKVGLQNVVKPHNIQTLKFHSRIEHSWLGKLLTTPKGFGKFYRKPGEKPPNSNEKSSNPNTTSSAKQKEKVNMKNDKTGDKQGKNRKGGDGFEPKVSPLIIGFTLMSVATFLIYSEKASQ